MFVIGVFAFISFVPFTAPLIILIVSMANGGRVPIGNVIAIGTGIFVGFLPFRTFLWNTYGKDIYTFKEDMIELISGFKYFKNEKESAFCSTNLAFPVSLLGTKRTTIAFLLFNQGTVLFVAALNSWR